MITEVSQNSQSQNRTYTPPALPAHLSGIYALGPIVGHPNDEEVKAIHAAIRAVNAEALVPHLYNPDVSLQLAQHLFNVQLDIYRSKYPLSLLPREYTYTPPSLPTHIPITLEPVAGPPSNEQLKAVHKAIRVAESLGSSPLFDPDLNMELSQHFFNLQFARRIQESILGQFASQSDGSRPVPQETEVTPIIPTTPQRASIDLPVAASYRVLVGSNSPQNETPEIQVDHPSALDASARLEPSVSLRITELGESINTIKELMGESKGVLENINRVLIATQRNQTIVWRWSGGDGGTVQTNPINREGVTAAECGLPVLLYYCSGSNRKCYLEYLKDSQIARYLNFFGLGADLIEGDEEVQLKEGQRKEAEKLILRQIGLVR